MSLMTACVFSLFLFLLFSRSCPTLVSRTSYSCFPYILLLFPVHSTLVSHTSYSCFPNIFLFEPKSSTNFSPHLKSASFFALFTALFTSYHTILYLSYVSLHLFCNHTLYTSFLILTKRSTSSFHHSLPFLIPPLLSRFIPHAPLAHLITAFLKAIHSSSTFPTTF